MKKIYSFLLLTAMVSCRPLLHVTTTLNAKQLWQQHKRIAIIPFRVTSRDNEWLKKGELMLEMQNMKKLSFSIQNNMYRVLQSQINLSNLSVDIMPIDSTTQALAQFGITYNNLPIQNLNKLCSVLHVDAVIAGEVEFSNPLRVGSSTYGVSEVEKAAVWMQIYDKNKNTPIWVFKEANAARGYNRFYKRANYINGTNQEYLIAYMFDKAMKILPYVIKSPIKRYY